MKDLIDYIVKNLVTNPDKVHIEETTQDNNVNFSLSVDPSDMGIVIGKAGQTIKAIRRLLVTRAMAEHPGLKVFLNLQEVR